MKRERRNDEDLEKGCAFVRSLLQPLHSDALPAQQERARQAALTGLTKAIEIVARCNLSLEEQDNTLRTYGRAWMVLNAMDISDPGTHGTLVQVAILLEAAQHELVKALLEKGIELTRRETDT